MRKKVLFLLAILSTCVSAIADDGPRRSISTSGEATVYVVPDQAEIMLGVLSWDAKLADAKSDNDKSAAAVLDAIKGLGVDAKQISTEDVNVQIEYDTNTRAYHAKILGYTVRRGYVVKLRDLSLVSKVVDAALGNGANELGGVNFSSSELRKYRDQARKMAAKAAKEKAADLAGELDAAIGPVRTVNENTYISGNYGYYYNGYNGGYYRGYGGFGGGGNASQNAVAQGGGAGDNGGGGGDATTPPGQIAIRAAVSATFDLKDPPADNAKPSEKEPPAADKR